jgi:hypothetical protein
MHSGSLIKSGRSWIVAQDMQIGSAHRHIVWVLMSNLITWATSHRTIGVKHHHVCINVIHRSVR